MALCLTDTRSRTHAHSRQARTQAHRQRVDRALALTRLHAQRFHAEHPARELVVADDQRERRTALVGAAELRLEIAATEIQLEAQPRALAAQPLDDPQRLRRGARAA